MLLNTWQRVEGGDRRGSRLQRKDGRPSSLGSRNKAAGAPP